MLEKSVTLETSHPLMSALKNRFPENKLSMVVTCDVSQTSMGP